MLRVLVVCSVVAVGWSASAGAADCVDEASCNALVDRAKQPGSKARDFSTLVWTTALVDRCVNGELTACGEAGLNLLRGGRDLAGDATRACKLVTMTCKLGDPRSCAYEGVCFERGVERDRDVSMALRRFAQGCALDDGASCAFEAGLYEDAVGVAQDLARAGTLYRKSCEHGYPDACALFAALEIRAGRIEEAVPWMVRGCDEGSARTCATLAKMFADSDGPAPDASAALGYYEKACALDLGSACFAAAEAYTHARGTTGDRAKAATLYQEACDLGEGAGCHAAAAAMLADESQDVRRMARLIVRGCALGHAASCTVRDGLCREHPSVCE